MLFFFFLSFSAARGAYGSNLSLCCKLCYSHGNAASLIHCATVETLICQFFIFSLLSLFFLTFFPWTFWNAQAPLIFQTYRRMKCYTHTYIHIDCMYSNSNRKVSELFTGTILFVSSPTMWKILFNLYVFFHVLTFCYNLPSTKSILLLFCDLMPSNRNSDLIASQVSLFLLYRI